MKTYYIPTSSLNFNNIFSSESISPKGFYSRRNFGYSRWMSIPENPFNGVVLLYGEPKMFQRPMSDLEDHPMLIEIKTDEEFPLLSEGVHYSPHTIYLDPWHTHVYFFSETDKTTALSMSNSSLETKMLRLYRRHIDVKTFESSYTAIENAPDYEISELEVSKDIKINKLKGLLYGYYIGAYLSISKDSVRQLHSLYEINDIVSAILSNPERKANLSQQQELSKFINILNQYNPIYRELLRFENNEVDRVEMLFQLLRTFGIYIPITKTDDLLYSLASESIEQSPTLIEIQQQITDIKKQPHSLLRTDDSELVVGNNCVLTLKHPNAEVIALYKTWIEKVLLLPKYNGKINPERSELATELTIIARDDIYKENWEKSQAKISLNQLRRHLQGEEYTQSWNNGLLSSLAAVLIKGDNWEQLLQFMQYKEMFDYRLAFSLYGVLNGFANLTRDFTDNLLELESSYVTEVYTEFYGQLFDQKLNIKTVEEPEITVLSQGQLHPDFYDQVISIWEMYPKKDRNKTNTIIEILNGCSYSTTRQEFISRLSRTKGFTRGGAIDYIKKELIQAAIDNNQQVMLSNVAEQSLFSTGKIIEDTGWIAECENMIIDKKARKQFHEDVIWFINNHKEFYQDIKKGIVKGKYFRHEKSNIRVYERLKYFLEDRRNPRNINMRWLCPIYEKIPISEILSKIKQEYGI